MNLRLMALNIRQFCPDLSIPVIKQRINVRYKQILGYEDWAFLYDSVTVRLYGYHASVTGETIAVTQGSINVIGTGTTFTDWAVGDYIRVDDDNQPYILATISSDTACSIEQSYATASDTAAEYDIFRPVYSTGADDVAEILGIVYQQPLIETSRSWITSVDPERTSTGSPKRYTIHTKTQSHGVVSFEVWPIPDQDYVVTVHYKKLISDLTADSDEPVFRADLLEAGALWDCYRQEFAVTQNPAYMGLARDSQKEYFNLLRDAIHEELRTDSVNERVREVMFREAFFDDEFRLDHDTEL